LGLGHARYSEGSRQAIERWSGGSRLKIAGIDNECSVSGNRVVVAFRRRRNALSLSLRGVRRLRPQGGRTAEPMASERRYFHAPSFSCAYAHENGGASLHRAGTFSSPNGFRERPDRFSL